MEGQEDTAHGAPLNLPSARMSVRVLPGAVTAASECESVCGRFHWGRTWLVIDTGGRNTYRKNIDGAEDGGYAADDG